MLILVNLKATKCFLVKLFFVSLTFELISSSETLLSATEKQLSHVWKKREVYRKNQLSASFLHLDLFILLVFFYSSSVEPWHARLARVGTGPSWPLTRAMAAKQAGQSSPDVATSLVRTRDGTGIPHLHPAHRLPLHLTSHPLEHRWTLFPKTLLLVPLVFLYPLMFKD